jgi:hypothetical protein
MATALITGASSGIGAAFARELAQRSMDLVLVARSATKLQLLAHDLNQRHQVQVEVIVQDLLEPDAATTVYQWVQNLGWSIDMLINNAGFGDYGVFCDRDRQRQPQMLERQSGSILNIASIAGFQPIPYLSVYAATKAFVLSFSEALWAETKAQGVCVLAVCPGPTDSQFFEVAEFPTSFSGRKQKLVPAEEVVQEALKALAAKRANVVTGGFGNQVVVNLSRFWPRQALVGTVEQFFRPSPQPKEISSQNE